MSVICVITFYYALQHHVEQIFLSELSAQHTLWAAVFQLL